MQIKYSCVQKKATEYPKLAEKAVSGETPGSSAGGEQPKFLTYTKKGHVIVKFSPEGSGREAIRWRDLLVCEHLALKLLRDSNQSAVMSSLVEYKDRMFLEALRFDRQDNHGRIASISLRIIDAEFVGSLENWIVTAEKLFELGCLSKSSVEKIRIAHFFGQWIQNTDMHFGNLSLTLGENQFEVLPLYDMLPMRFAPVRGEILNQSFKVPENTARSHGAWLESGELACQYWELIFTDSRLSKPFQAMAKTFIPLCRSALKKGQ